MHSIGQTNTPLRTESRGKFEFSKYVFYLLTYLLTYWLRRHKNARKSAESVREASVVCRNQIETRNAIERLRDPTALRSHCAALRCRGAAKRFRGVARRERLGGEHLGTPAAHPRHCPIVALQIEQSTEIAGARTMKISVRS